MSGAAGGRISRDKLKALAIEFAAMLPPLTPDHRHPELPPRTPEERERRTKYPAWCWFDLIEIPEGTPCTELEDKADELQRRARELLELQITLKLSDYLDFASLCSDLLQLAETMRTAARLARGAAGVSSRRQHCSKLTAMH